MMDMTHRERKIRHWIKIGLLAFAIITLGILIYKDVNADDVVKIPSQVEYLKVNPDYVYEANVTKIVDGDTFEATVKLGLNVSCDVKIRVKDLDTAEIRGAKSECEKTHGQAATDMAQIFLTRPGVFLKFKQPLKTTFDRYEAEVFVLGGYRYATIMIASGMEKYSEYNGVGAKYFKSKYRVNNLKQSKLSEANIVKWECD